MVILCHLQKLDGAWLRPLAPEIMSKRRYDFGPFWVGRNRWQISWRRTDGEYLLVLYFDSET